MKFEDFLSIEIAGDIGIVWFDNKLESMNVVSPGVIELFPQIDGPD